MARDPLTPLNLFSHYRGQSKRPTNYAQVVSRLGQQRCGSANSDLRLRKLHPPGIFPSKLSASNRGARKVASRNNYMNSASYQPVNHPRFSRPVRSTPSFSRGSRLITLAIIEDRMQPRGRLLGRQSRNRLGIEDYNQVGDR